VQLPIVDADPGTPVGLRDQYHRASSFTLAGLFNFELEHSVDLGLYADPSVGTHPVGVEPDGLEARLNSIRSSVALMKPKYPLQSRSFRIIIRIKHRSVSSGGALAATYFVYQSFHKAPEHAVSFPAVSSVLLSHSIAKRFRQIYLDTSGHIPDSGEKPGF